MIDIATELHPENWYSESRGARYRQLFRRISEMIGSGALPAGEQLPSEREIAQIAQISRVTVRKAFAELTNAGLIEQRRGAGSFVRGGEGRAKQSLSALISFTENLKARGITPSSQLLLAGLYSPSSLESTILGVAPYQQVARVHRLRSGNDTPMALELSSLPEDVLPRPDKVGTSIYETLRNRGASPTRALQSVTAIIATGTVA